VNVQPGDLVLLIFEHGYEVIAAFWGAIHLGAVPTVLPYFDTEPTPEVYHKPLSSLAEFAEAQAIVTLPRFAAAVEQWRDGRNCLVVSQPSASPHAVPSVACTARRGEDLAYIQLTTGSTGASKGGMISHRCIFNRMAAYGPVLDIFPNDVTAYWWPLYQTAGLQTMIIAPVVIGCTTISASPRLWTHRPHLFLQAVSRFRANCSTMTNSALLHCVRTVRDQDIAGIDLSSWRILAIGGEAVQFESLQAFATRFAPYGFSAQALRPFYTGTECGQICSARAVEASRVDWVSRADLDEHKQATPQAPHADGAKPIVSCGVLAPGVEITIEDEDGKPLSERCVGEVVVRSPTLFSGYYRRPDLTSQVLRDGRVYTGDLGYVADGQVYLCDRKKDVIIIGGKNIYAVDLESTAEKVLGQVSGGAVAFGVPDTTLGTERPVLVAEVTQPLHEPDRKDLIQRIRHQVFRLHGVALADVRLVEAGWIVTMSKISRNANRQKYLSCGFHPPTSQLQFASSTGQNLDEAETDFSHANLEQLLTEFFTSALGGAPVGREENFFALGGDSLTFVNLIVALEDRLKRALPVEELAENPTIAAMAEVLSRGTITPRPSVMVHNYALDPLAVMKQVLADSTLSWTAKGRRLRELSRIRLTTTGPRLFGHTLPYASGSKILEIVCRYPEVMRLVFRKRAKLLHDGLAALGSPIRETEALQQHLRTFLWMSWRLAALAQCSPAEFDAWVTITGMEEFQRTREKGQGAVIPLSNIGPRGLPVLALRRLGLTDFMMVGTEDLYAGILDLVGFSDLKERHHFFITNRDHRRASQLLTAQRLLQRGGVVLIAGDGQLGKLPFLFPFCRRLRRFGFGFAELALRTGAPIFPMFSTVQPGGKVHVEFCGPLTASSSTHQESAAHLVQEYVTLLERYWYKDPGSIRFYSLEKFLELPVASPNRRVLDAHSRAPENVAFPGK
jgi:acyl-CoA synthetase (AMP-forming)/AMP-acid ligase II/acyl carrier protein/lauroyl/myristoyl acyltransferase